MEAKNSPCPDTIELESWSPAFEGRGLTGSDGRMEGKWQIYFILNSRSIQSILVVAFWMAESPAFEAKHLDLEGTRRMEAKDIPLAYLLSRLARGGFFVS
jgi:hypothetical protein